MEPPFDGLTIVAVGPGRASAVGTTLKYSISAKLPIPPLSENEPELNSMVTRLLN